MSQTKLENILTEEEEGGLGSVTQQRFNCTTKQKRKRMVLFSGYSLRLTQVLLWLSPISNAVWRPKLELACSALTL